MKKKTATHKTNKASDLNKDVLKFKLHRICLIQSGSKLGNVRENGLPEDISTSLGLFVKHVTYEDKTDGIIADLSHELKATYKDSTEAPAFEITATFQLEYSLTDTHFRLEDLEEACKSLIIASAWPYWREFVQTMTTRMCLPPLTMPIQNVVKTAEQLKRVSIIENATTKASSGKRLPS